MLFEPWPPKMGRRTRGILSSMVGTKKTVPHEAPEGTLPGKPIRVEEVLDGVATLVLRRLDGADPPSPICEHPRSRVSSGGDRNW